MEPIKGLDERLPLHDHRVPSSFPFVYVDNTYDLLGVVLHGSIGTILCTVTWAVHSAITWCDQKNKGKKK